MLATFTHNQMFRVTLVRRRTTKVLDRCAPSLEAATADAQALTEWKYRGFRVECVEPVASFVEFGR